ncbi:hypothetical protein [Microcoleus sp. MON1_C5]|uniref:hypothetical protein n=1 Tax=Microcoleus sp. MON1_C5 TaxID=2818828 RepID=UPI00403F26E4
MAIEVVPVVARTPQLIRTFNPPLVGMAIEADLLHQLAAIANYSFNPPLVGMAIEALSA